MKIALITDPKYPMLDGESHLVEQFTKQGYEASIEVWSDPKVDWIKYDAAIMRSCYDLIDTPEEFFAWVDQIKDKTKVYNNPEVLRWNVHKSYLEELHQRGIKVPQLSIIRTQAAAHNLGGTFSGKVVIKPCIGGSGRGVELFDTLGSEAHAYIEQLLEDGDVLVQEFVEEIADGEISVVFFGNQLNHAVRKVPPTGEYRTNWKFGARPQRIELTPLQQEKITDIYQQASVDTLYARVDVVERAGELALMELEIINPYLYIEGHDDLAADFAQAFKSYTK